jgi:hypothetical protein
MEQKKIASQVIARGGRIPIAPFTTTTIIVDSTTQGSTKQSNNPIPTLLSVPKPSKTEKTTKGTNAPKKHRALSNDNTL